MGIFQYERQREIIQKMLREERMRMAVLNNTAQCSVLKQFDDVSG